MHFPAVRWMCLTLATHVELVNRLNSTVAIARCGSALWHVFPGVGLKREPEAHCTIIPPDSFFPLTLAGV